jgi:hypothetical protein
MNEPQALEDVIAGMVWGLWARCITRARWAGLAVAEGVEQLILDSREIIAAEGIGETDSDRILFGIYTWIHWDCDRPTDRVFEALLEFELEQFLKIEG